jgi:hypothetical protein
MTRATTDANSYTELVVTGLFFPIQPDPPNVRNLSPTEFKLAVADWLAWCIGLRGISTQCNGWSSSITMLKKGDSFALRLHLTQTPQRLAGTARNGRTWMLSDLTKHRMKQSRLSAARSSEQVHYELVEVRKILISDRDLARHFSIPSISRLENLSCEEIACPDHIKNRSHAISNTATLVKALLDRQKPH